ncbi:MAG: lipase family protein [Tannerella sp.]|jgi:pimeloyl-ACP methyl ester carboxylesterase|nr:lipase family protein [Tannerella sp.]
MYNSKWFLFLVGLFFLISCSDDDNNGILPKPSVPPEVVEKDELQVRWKLLKEFTFEELQEAEKKLGIKILLGDTVYKGNIQMQALKVTCKSAHPDGSGQKIDLSGMILMPPAIDSTAQHRIVVAMPYTYVKNSQAPTSQFTDYNVSNLEAYMIFWMIKASQGYIVIIPDYPGFGDSHGKCFVPYIESKSMVRTTFDFLRAARVTLDKNNFAGKTGIVVTGYSLGGFVAASLVRELETNPKDGYAVDLLYVGGAPLRLKQISDLVRKAETLETPYLIPYAIWGYKKNSYPDLSVKDILNEPYASESDAYFDGNHAGIGNLFPKSVNKLFTNNFIIGKGNTYTYVSKILDENSVKPWINKCRFVMIHGQKDETVYYANAVDYVQEHKAAGGKVTFIPNIVGTHTSTGIFYFVNMLLQLPQ